MQPDIVIKDSFAITAWTGVTPARRSDYHRVLLVGNGHGQLQIDDAVFELERSSIFLVAKGQVYAFAEGSDIDAVEVCFGDCFWERAPASASNCKAVLFNNASANQQLTVPAAAYIELQSLFILLQQEFEKPDYLNKLDALAAYLKIIMIKIANVHALLTQGSDSYDAKLYRAFLELVSQQYHELHDVAGFARQLGISARRLSDLCRRCSGTGAKEIINGQLIAEAKRALQFSARAVKEIAFDLNFTNPDQFSQFFKKGTHYSPQQYRAQFVNLHR